MTKIKLVVFDMDGTLLHPRSCWAYIHEHFGTDNTEMLKLYIERKISDKEFVKADFKLWQSSTKETVNEKYSTPIANKIKVSYQCYENSEDISQTEYWNNLTQNLSELFFFILFK